MLPIPLGDILNDLGGTEVLYLIITSNVEGSVPSRIYIYELFPWGWSRLAETCSEIINIILFISYYIQYCVFIWARSVAVGWGTALQAESSRVPDGVI